MTVNVKYEVQGLGYVVMGRMIVTTKCYCKSERLKETNQFERMHENSYLVRLPPISTKLASAKLQYLQIF